MANKADQVTTLKVSGCSVTKAAFYGLGKCTGCDYCHLHFDQCNKNINTENDFCFQELFIFHFSLLFTNGEPSSLDINIQGSDTNNVT